MLCTEAQNLPELIVSHLAYQPEMNIEELQEAINPKLKKPITQRGWYKAVRGLLDSEVLVKTRRVYSLNYAWLEQMRLFSHITTATYLNEKDQQKNITHLKKESRINMRSQILSQLIFFGFISLPCYLNIRECIILFLLPPLLVFLGSSVYDRKTLRSGSSV